MNDKKKYQIIMSLLSCVRKVMDDSVVESDAVVDVYELSYKDFNEINNMLDSIIDLLEEFIAGL